MKKLLLWTPVVIAGAIAVHRLLPAERRIRLSRLPGVMITKIMEHMPDE